MSVWPLVAGMGMGTAGLITTAAVGASSRIRRDSRPRPLQKADAILVFGAAVWPTGPSLSLQTRVGRAAEVSMEEWALLLLCSGGISSGSPKP